MINRQTYSFLLTEFLMLTPACIGFVVEKKKFSETTKTIELNFKHTHWKQSMKHLNLTIFYYCFLIMFNGYLLGNVLEINGFRKLATDYTMLNDE